MLMPVRCLRDFRGVCRSDGLAHSAGHLQRNGPVYHFALGSWELIAYDSFSHVLCIPLSYTKDLVMRTKSIVWTLAATFVFSTTIVEAAEWTRFRGTNGTGVAEDVSLPAEFGPEKNLVWKAEVPFSSSSPVLVNDALYLTASNDDHLLVLQLDAKTGAITWQREIERSRQVKVHSANDSASPTPVIDGDKIYAFFQELGVVSYTLDGEHCWTLPLGPFKQYYGMAGSPVVAGELVVLQCDEQEEAFLLAIDKHDGSVVWKTDRATRSSSWSTPVVYPSADAPQAVVVHGNGYVDAYAIDDGKYLWGSAGFGSGPTTSPLLDGNRMYTNAPQWGEHSNEGFQLATYDELAKKFDKNGDTKFTREELEGDYLSGEFGWGDLNMDDFITKDEYEDIYEGFYSEDYGLTALEFDPSNPTKKAEVLWRYQGRISEISSPLVYRDIAYFADKKGYINSVNANNGELLKRERIPGAGANFFSSPVAADGKIFFGGMTGKMAVIEAGAEWNVLSVNDLGDRITASPVVGDDRLYVRTKSAVFCFGEK